jgi:hypothetical protein
VRSLRHQLNSFDLFNLSKPSTTPLLSLSLISPQRARRGVGGRVFTTLVVPTRYHGFLGGRPENEGADRVQAGRGAARGRARRPDDPWERGRLRHVPSMRRRARAGQPRQRVRVQGVRDALPRHGLRRPPASSGLRGAQRRVPEGACANTFLRVRRGKHHRGVEKRTKATRSLSPPTPRPPSPAHLRALERMLFYARLHFSLRTPPPPAPVSRAQHFSFFLAFLHSLSTERFSLLSVTDCARAWTGRASATPPRCASCGSSRLAWVARARRRRRRRRVL